MLQYDSISYVWSDRVVAFIRSLNESVFFTDVDNKYKLFKLAVLRQNANSDSPVKYESGKCLPDSLIDDFKFDFQGIYEYHLYKWLYRINYVDEIVVSPSASFAEVNHVLFNATKFSNLLLSLSLDEVIERFTENFVLFTELVYYREFFGCQNKKSGFLCALFLKKLIVFSYIWVEKEKATKISYIDKKLCEITVAVKLYSIILSLPITTSRKMFSFFKLLSTSSSTKYEAVVVRSPYFISLHDFFYKNCIVNIFDYQNSTNGRNCVHLRKMLENYTVGEVGEYIYDKRASVFNDTSVYEKLDSEDGNVTVEELLKNSKWFVDLTSQQQQDLLPLISLHKDGEYRTPFLRHENQWFVNGGCDTGGEGEWEEWRRYVIQLKVKHLENYEENDVPIEVR